MSSSRLLLVIVVLLGLLVAACGPTSPEIVDPEPDDEEPATDQEAEPGTEDDEPGEPEDDPPAEDPEADESEVTVYFVRSHDSGFWVEPETHEIDDDVEAVIRAAMELLFAGEPHDPDLTSAAPPDVEILATNVADGVLTVDVSADIADHGTGSAMELAFAEQLAHTAAAFPTVGAVQLWVDGEPIDDLWGHVGWSGAFEPSPFAVSPITITTPPAGAAPWTTDPGEVVLAGEAQVFEATFDLRVTGPDGEVLVEDFVTASTGAPDRGTWEYPVEVQDAGTYTVEVEEQDPSDGEGRPPFAVSRTFEVG